MRASALTDRKGRPVAVERYGERPAQEAPRRDFGERVRIDKRARFGERNDERKGERKDEQSRKPARKPPGRRRAPDRARGARPHQPKGRK